jgi:hypothetical protein
MEIKGNIEDIGNSIKVRPEVPKNSVNTEAFPVSEVKKNPHLRKFNVKVLFETDNDFYLEETVEVLEIQHNSAGFYKLIFENGKAKQVPIALTILTEL